MAELVQFMYDTFPFTVDKDKLAATDNICYIFAARGWVQLVMTVYKDSLPERRVKVEWARAYDVPSRPAKSLVAFHLQPTPEIEAQQRTFSNDEAAAVKPEPRAPQVSPSTS